MHTTSHSLLIRIAESGKNDDWQRLLTIYRPYIASVVNGFPAIRSQVDDIVQDVMLVLLRELPSFQRQRSGSFRSWLRNITVNQLRIALRKSKRFPQQAAEFQQVEDFVSQLEDPASEASRLWDEEHDRVVLQRLMKMIRNDFQEQTWKAFQMHVLQNQSVKEVALQLEISTNTVFLAKSRILRKLRAEAAGLIDIDMK